MKRASERELKSERRLPCRGHDAVILRRAKTLFSTCDLYKQAGALQKKIDGLQILEVPS